MFLGLGFYTGTKSVDKKRKVLSLEPKWQKTVGYATARFLYMKPTYCV